MRERRRRLIVVVIMLLMPLAGAFYESIQSDGLPGEVETANTVRDAATGPAINALGDLPIKGRAPKTGYDRDNFSAGWAEVKGCDMRDYILARDMKGVVTISENDCSVLQGTLLDPYTGKTIMFVSGPGTSVDVQIDHVVALSNAWQTGAQQLSFETRFDFANDPLNLLAVDGPTNQKKGDADAATWLPPNKEYRCRYIARQIAVKLKYRLWVTKPENEAMRRVLNSCPNQQLPVES